MKAINYRKKTESELITDLELRQSELAILKFDLKIGKEKNSANAVKLRKDIARIKTVINESSYTKSILKSDKIDNSIKN